MGYTVPQTSQDPGHMRYQKASYEKPERKKKKKPLYLCTANYISLKLRFCSLHVMHINRMGATCKPFEPYMTDPDLPKTTIICTQKSAITPKQVFIYELGFSTPKFYWFYTELFF